MALTLAYTLKRDCSPLGFTTNGQTIVGVCSYTHANTLLRQPWQAEYYQVAWTLAGVATLGTQCGHTDVALPAKNYFLPGCRMYSAGDASVATHILIGSVTYNYVTTSIAGAQLLYQYQLLNTANGAVPLVTGTLSKP